MTAEIPLDILFGDPERTYPRLSYDGRRLAWLAPLDGVLNVFVGPVDGDGAGEAVTHDQHRPIRLFLWAHDDRHILHLQDSGGDENWHVYATDIGSGEVRDLTPLDGVQATVIATDRHQPTRVLVGLNHDNPQWHDVYSVDVQSGELTLEERNPGFSGWLADPNLVVRLGIRSEDDGTTTWLIRDRKDDDWRELLTLAAEDRGSQPVSFSRDGRSLFALTSEGRDTAALVQIDLASGARTTLAADERYDVVGALLHPETATPQAAYVAADRMRTVVLDEAIRADIASIEDIEPRGEVSVVSRDHADQTWVVAVAIDVGPVSYHLYDRLSGSARLLFDTQPALREATLAPMEPFAFTARDGERIEGYLTFPAQGERRNLPAVLYVHGGPWARDVWGYNPVAQWLANRGCLCVQVNYRGSTGYGKRFVNIADRQWAGTMHDDLIDAVRWIVDQGYADADRVAIYGGSYGGYAALTGVTFTPDVFCCAVDIVGPSNLVTLIESIPPYWRPMQAMWRSRVGDPVDDRDLLWSRSPLSRVDEIRVPLLIAQGANDPRVKQAESEQIVAAMREKGIPHEYLLFADEGHGFARPENRLTFQRRADEFLREHLRLDHALGGTRAEPATAEVRGA